MDQLMTPIVDRHDGSVHRTGSAKSVKQVIADYRRSRLSAA